MVQSAPLVCTFWSRLYAPFILASAFNALFLPCVVHSTGTVWQKSCTPQFSTLRKRLAFASPSARRVVRLTQAASVCKPLCNAGRLFGNRFARCAQMFPEHAVRQPVCQAAHLPVQSGGHRELAAKDGLRVAKFQDRMGGLPSSVIRSPRMPCVV